VDSYASLLVLLLANFFVIELVTDARWGAVASILLAVAALIVAISDPEAGKGLETWHWIVIGVCVALAPIVLLVTSSSVLGVAYLIPVGLLASATLPAATGTAMFAVSAAVFFSTPESWSNSAPAVDPGIPKPIA